MNSIDLLIVALLLMSVVRGYHIGFIRQGASTIGFVGGLFVGSWAANVFSPQVESQAGKTILALSVPLAVSFILMTAAEVGAIGVKRKIVSIKVHQIDGAFGSLMSVFTLGVALWVFSTLMMLGAASPLHAAMKSSLIIGAIDRHVPSANTFLSSLNKLIDPNSTPQVFTGREPSPDAAYRLPPLSQFAPALTAARPSLVKISGLGCGGIVNGSGFVYSNNRVATNAHVVAGVQAPKVQDSSGTHDATVVGFDKNNDLAVLYVPDLRAAALPLERTVQPPGTPGIVVGFPGGGAFAAQLTVLVERFRALGRDIYGQGQTKRDVYAIQAEVVQGNSGGPILSASGQVIAVVFATSTTYNNIGYALSVPQVMPFLTSAAGATAATSTGACSE